MPACAWCDLCIRAHNRNRNTDELSQNVQSPTLLVFSSSQPRDSLETQPVAESSPQSVATAGDAGLRPSCRGIRLIAASSQVVRASDINYYDGSAFDMDSPLDDPPLESDFPAARLAMPTLRAVRAAMN